MASILFIAAIIVIALIITILLFKIMHKKARDQEHVRQNLVFMDLVHRNKLEIKESEIIHNCLLAIDEANFILVFIHFGGLKEEVHLVDLWDVKVVQVVTEDEGVHGPKNGMAVFMYKQVNKLHLEVSLKDFQRKIHLALFQCSDGWQHYPQIKQRANYWAAVINNCVRELSQPAAYRIGNL